MSLGASGYAERASEVDIMHAFGYGFPRFRGGPMLHADTLGLPAVVERVQRYATTQRRRLANVDAPRARRRRA